MKTPVPRKLPSGSWMCRVMVNGVDHCITADTEKECLLQAVSVKAGKQAEKKASLNITLREAIDTYIEKRQASISPATVRNYRGVQRTRFQSLMDMPITRLTDAVCQKAINAEAKAVSGKTIKNSWSVISSALEDCGCTRPKIFLPPVIKNEHEFLSAEEIPAFLSEIEGSSAEVPILLALHSLRISEVMSITWPDIDLKHETIRVSGSAVYDENEQLVHKQTNKTSNSNRTVPIMIPRLLQLLTEAERKGEYVVRLHENTIRREISRACTRAGLPNVGCHGLRHSFASLALITLNMPQDVVMRIGGWDCPQTMKTVYTHVSQKAIKDYATEARSYFANLK